MEATGPRHHIPIIFFYWSGAPSLMPKWSVVFSDCLNLV